MSQRSVGRTSRSSPVQADTTRLARARSTGALARAELAQWPVRRWLVAAGAALVTTVVVAVPTAMIPNPVFGREIATTVWAWPALVVSAVLSGLLVTTYLRVAPSARPAPAGADDGGREGRLGGVGGLLTFFAVGCPVCNKLALLALGYTGAIQWFAPVQPWLAAGALVLLGYALVRRLAGARACPVPRA